MLPVPVQMLPSPGADMAESSASHGRVLGKDVVGGESGRSVREARRRVVHGAEHGRRAVARARERQACARPGLVGEERAADAEALDARPVHERAEAAGQLAGRKRPLVDEIWAVDVAAFASVEANLQGRGLGSGVAVE